MQKLKAKLSRLQCPFDSSDLLIAIGLFMLGIGLWWVYPPCSLIVVGSIIVWVGVGSPAFRPGKGDK